MIDMKKYGLREESPRQGEALTARVTAVHKERYELICESGPCFGRLKAAAYFRGGEVKFPTVGDFVLIISNPGGDSVILETLPRRTFFSRRDPYSGKPVEQAVAANFDSVFLMQSLNENFNTGRLLRYLAQTRQSGAQPVIVLTKSDLPGDHGAMLAQAEDIAGGARVIAVSAKTGQGLDALNEYLRPGSTVALLGSSGVGKSSLINRLMGEEVMRTGEIRAKDGRGRHTTTYRQLIFLPGGAMVIDTPGMRELGMWDAGRGLDETFADVEQYLGQCRFPDCRHETEPGCAIRAAIENGTLSAKRWKEYQKLKREITVPRKKWKSQR